MNLMDRIQRLAGRLFRVHLAAGTAWALVAAVFVLAVVVWLDLMWELSPIWRISAWFFAGGAAIVRIGSSVATGFKRSKPLQIAQGVDQLLAGRGHVRAGVDLAINTLPDAGLSQGLAALAIQSASEQVKLILPYQIAPVKPAMRAWFVCLVLGAMALTIALTMPNFADSTWKRFTDPFGDHPPYSHWIFHVEPGDTTVFFGAPLEVHVKLEGGIADKVELFVLNEGAETPEKMRMFPEGTGLWRAVLTSVTSQSIYWVRAPGGRSRRFACEVVMTPKIEQTRVRLEWPAYANRPPYDGPMPQGAVSALVGSQIQLFAKSNRPLKNGLLVNPVTREKVELKSVSKADPTEVSGSFVARETGKWQLSVTDEDDRKSIEETIFPLQVFIDEPPILRVLQPGPVSYATPSAVIPIVLSAEDDLGVAKLFWRRNLNDSRPLAAPHTPIAPPAPRVTKTSQLSLASLGLVKGDEVRIFARAEDANPTGPGFAESPPHSIKIISQEEFDRMVRVQRSIEMLLSKYQQAKRRLEQAQGEIERLQKKNKDANDNKARDELAKDLQDASDRFRAEAAALEKLAKMEGMYDLDEALKKHLSSAARQLQRLSEETQKLAKSRLSPQEMAEHLQAMLGEAQRESEELERNAIAPIESLAAAMPILENEIRLMIVYRRQKALVESLEKLTKEKAEAVPRNKLRDGQKTQESIRKLLEKILEELENDVAKIDPADESLKELLEDVRSFLEAAEKLQIPQSMSKAETHLGEFDLAKGHAHAREALEKLEKLLKKNEPMEGQGFGSPSGQAKLRFAPGIGKAMKSTMQKMLGDRGLNPGEKGGQSKGPGESEGAEGDSSQRADQASFYGSASFAPDLPIGNSKAADRLSAKSAGQAGKNSDLSTPPTDAGPNSRNHASGVEAVVPQIYRRRVAEYFQRIADETAK